MTTLTATPDAQHADAVRPRRFSSTRLAGIGGLAFAASVIVQNILRAGYPTNDASAGDVIDYYGDHRAITIALAALFPVGIAGLTTFVGGFAARVWGGPGRAAAVSGLVGAAGIIGNFTILLATDTAISGYVHRGAADTSVVEAMWVTHSSMFGVLLASIGVALAGLSTAAVRSGLLANRWRTIGLTGAALLLGTAATTPFIIDGSPTMFVGLAGFLTWVAFLVAASVKLLRA